MTLRLASFALGAFFLLGAPAFAADSTGNTGSGSSTPSARAASADACKGASEGATCKFQGRRGQVSGTCTNRNGALACVPAHRGGMHHGGQGAPTPMQ